MGIAGACKGAVGIARGYRPKQWSLHPGGRTPISAVQAGILAGRGLSMRSLRSGRLGLAGDSAVSGPVRPEALSIARIAPSPRVRSGPTSTRLARLDCDVDRRLCGWRLSKGFEKRKRTVGIGTESDGIVEPPRTRLGFKLRGGSTGGEARRGGLVR